MRAWLVAVLLVATACGAGKPDQPGWKGPNALPAERGTATEFAVERLTIADPEARAARALGAKPADVTVTATAESITAERPKAGGEVPGEATAITQAKRVLTAFGMVPAEWGTRSIALGGTRTVLFEASVEVPVFPFKGITKPAVAVRVDAGGPQFFLLTPVRLTPREVPIVSATEALGRLEPGRYVAVREVLAADASGRIRPYWEFTDDDKKKHPVPAVLTP